MSLMGGYESQTTRQLAQINSTKYPDTNKDFEANITRLNTFVDYIAQYLQVMQKGVDQANQDAIGRVRDLAADLMVLLGGGQLLYGIDLGDLQYFLPALGAIFGFDSSKPLPVSLFEMAERFFLGYVVPLDAFAVVIIDIINGWATALGLDPDFVAALNEVMNELVLLGTNIGDILTALWNLLDIFGLNGDGSAFGPFAELWHVITQILGSFNLVALGNLVDPLLHEMAPWIHELAVILGHVNAVLEAFSGDIDNVDGIINFASMFTPFVDLISGVFDPIEAWIQMITNVLIPQGGLLTNLSPLNVDNLLGTISARLLPPIHIGRLTNQLPDLISDSGFDTIPVGEIDAWYYDVTHGHNKLGCAAIGADGGYHELFNNIVAVAPGQKYAPSAWASWEGATSTAGSLQLMIMEFLLGEQVGTTLIASATPSGTASFSQMSGSYTVPVGVDAVVVVVAVTSGFTAGIVRVDDISGPSTGLLRMDWTENLVQRWEQIASLFGIIDTDLDGDVDFNDVWNTLWDDYLKPFDWIPNIAQNTVDGIWNGWANLGDSLDSGLLSTIVPNAIAGLLGMNLNNASSIAVAEAAIKVLQSAGNTITDDFARGAASTPGGNYNVLLSAGGGAGALGTDGSGNLVWYPSGSGDRTLIYRYIASQITTDSAILRVVFSSNPPATTPDVYTYICGWVDSTAQTFLCLRIDDNNVVLQAVIAGVVTNLKSWSINCKSGDTLELQRGQTGNTQLHRYILRLNNTQIDDWTDPGAVAASGVNKRGTGVGMGTSLRFVIFPPEITQWKPASIAIISFSEVL